MIRLIAPEKWFGFLNARTVSQNEVAMRATRGFLGFVRPQIGIGNICRTFNTILMFSVYVNEKMMKNATLDESTLSECLEQYC